MKKAILFLAILLASGLSGIVSAQESVVIDEVCGYIRNSNTKELGKKSASALELSILGEEDVYSRVQAELILKNFFSKHQPSSVKLIHKLDSNPNYRFAVVELITGNGKFRVSFSLKNNSGTFLITEMRIENKD